MTRGKVALRKWKRSTQNIAGGATEPACTFKGCQCTVSATPVAGFCPVAAPGVPSLTGRRSNSGSRLHVGRQGHLCYE